ncbi:MAG: hypothetical protein IJ524_06400 [Bacteroidales bacterium]|nr:hypothetical protein [Bacteroidales bacterium]
MTNEQSLAQTINRMHDRNRRCLQRRMLSEINRHTDHWASGINLRRHIIGGAFVLVFLFFSTPYAMTPQLPDKPMNVSAPFSRQHALLLMDNLTQQS